MRLRAADCLRGYGKFFSLALQHDTLENHYRTNFNLQHFHHWTLTDLDNMLPFERDVYVNLLNQQLERDQQQAAQQAQQ